MSSGGGHPVVTIVVPTLAEEQDIAGCIEAIGAQTYPADSMELLVVDGCSPDRTRDIARNVATQFEFRRVELISNPAQGTSSNLNVGLREASGEVLVRVDARARIPRDYVTQVVEHLRDHPETGVIGGKQLAVPRTDSVIDSGIARALRNRLTTGLSRYRRSSRSGPSDTVWMGAFRVGELRDAGGWDERLTVNEDFDLNARYRARGMTVWFDAGLRSEYVARSGLRAVAVQYYRYGVKKGGLLAIGQGPSPRHVAVLLLPIAGGVALTILTRRLGPTRAAALVAASALGIDNVGSSEPADLRERVAATVVTLAVTSSWWTGAIVGLGRSVFRR